MRAPLFLLLALMALPAAAQQPARDMQHARPARQQPRQQQQQPTSPAPQPPPEPAPAPNAEPGTGSETGLSLPRFAALRSNDVNLRVGPGTEYPAAWTYHRRNLPVEIVAEFRNWRQIRDMDGTVGWVHAATLTGKRSFVVRSAEVTMRRRPEPDASPVARLMPGVVGLIRTCPERNAWCEVQAGDYRGWLPRGGVWGVGPDEAVGG